MGTADRRGRAPTGVGRAKRPDARTGPRAPRRPAPPPAKLRHVTSLTRVLLQTEVEFKTHIRSKVALFWTLLFPILLFVLFSVIFGQQSNVRIDLWVQDNDRSQVSRNFQGALNQI